MQGGARAGKPELRKLLPGEPGTAVPGCVAWMLAVSRGPLGFASRLGGREHYAMLRRRILAESHVAASPAAARLEPRSPEFAEWLSVDARELRAATVRESEPAKRLLPFRQSVPPGGRSSS